jgi:dihydroxyacetone kinase
MSAEVPSPSLRAVLAAVAASGGDIAVNTEPLYARVTTQVPDRRVALVSGGGAGHEPLHIGFLGAGGLDAVCPGEVFASPHSRQIYEAGRAVALPGGVLYIVKNYTGDIINFGIAAERLSAEGIPVGTLIVQDDIGTASGAATGMRGTAATLVVEKILGGAADTGKSLEELLELGEQIVAGSRSVAVAFASHTDRESGEPVFALEDGLWEYGVGIHGERASSQIPAEGMVALAQRMTRDLLEANPSEQPLIVLVNGLGGMSNFDLANVAADVLDALESAGVEVESILFGTYVSALNMRGFSVTFTSVNPEWLPYWYAEHQTPGLPRPRPLERIEPSGPPVEDRVRTTSPWATGFARRLSAMRRAFNALDSAAGDGDFGDNFTRGLSAGIDTDSAPIDADTASDLRAISLAFLNDIGGSSGPLFGVLLQSAAASTQNAEALPAALARGLADGAAAVSRVGGAELGDRTMVDALAGFISGEILTVDHAAATRVLQDALATAGMRPRRGRATYLADRVGNIPDAGALALAGLVIGLSERLNEQDHSELWVALEIAVAHKGE